MFKFAEWIISGALMAFPAATDTAQQVTAVEPVTTAEQPAPAAFDATTALARANQALNDITTATGRFSQIDPSGHFSQGTFYISRPGRMRFEYDDPVPQTLVADGTTLAIEDRDLETIDRVPLSATPLNLILRESADLAADANILNIRKIGGLVAILISDKSGEAEGQLELFFDADNYDLRKWESVDVSGQRTTVDLMQVEKDVSLSARLFRLEDPEDEDERRR